MFEIVINSTVPYKIMGTPDYIRNYRNSITPPFNEGIINTMQISLLRDYYIVLTRIKHSVGSEYKLYFNSQDDFVAFVLRWS